MGQSDEHRERRRGHLRARPASPVDGVRGFLRTYSSDALTDEEMFGDIARVAAVSPRSLVVALDSLEAFLADPPRDGSVARLVAEDANRQLEDPSEAGSLRWLRETADRLRTILGQLPRND